MGMSEKLGFLAYSGDEQEVFLVVRLPRKNVSEKTADVIDSEVRRIMDSAYMVLKNRKTRRAGTSGTRPVGI